MSDSQPVTAARHPRVMETVIANGQHATIVDVYFGRVIVKDGDWQASIFIDRLRWTGTAWVIIPEHAA